MSVTRRRGLGRALGLLAGLAGMGAAGRAEAATRARGQPGTSVELVLYARELRSYSRGLRPGDPPARGDRLTIRAVLLDAPDGRAVGEFYAAGFALHGPGRDGPGAERLELHTFDLEDGTIIGSGTSGGAASVLGVLGGTGDYAGARGTYIVRRQDLEPAGGSDAEFVFRLIL